jgi:hypothetical protein
VRVRSALAVTTAHVSKGLRATIAAVPIVVVVVVVAAAVVAVAAGEG